MSRALPRGLYVITDQRLSDEERLVHAVTLAIAGGAVMVQYRDKGDDAERRRWEAGNLLNACRPLGVPLIINDDVALAAEVGADGVHIGQGDTTLAEARAALGPEAIIGVTCHNDLQLALAAEQGGADYVAFGSFFPSPTKPEAIRAELALLAEARRRLTVPVVAIGGINTDNGRQLLEAGADMLAVISEVFGQDDIRAAARAFTNLFA